MLDPADKLLEVLRGRIEPRSSLVSEPVFTTSGCRRLDPLLVLEISTCEVTGHGDRADRRLGYRISRGVLRSGVFAGAMRLLGPGYARRLGQALAGASHANMRPPGPLLDDQERWASERLRLGFDVVVLGHSHQPSVETTEDGVLVNLGDFVSHHSWLEVGETLTLHQPRAGLVEPMG